MPWTVILKVYLQKVENVKQFGLVLLVLVLTMTSCSEPDMTADFHDADGNAIYLGELNKKWLVVNYWATWCGPCIAEIPELNELSIEYADKLNLLGVNFDQPDITELPAQIRKMKITFPVFATDPADALHIEIPQVLPTTFIFAPGGELVKTFTGPQTMQSLLKVINPDVAVND